MRDAFHCHVGLVYPQAERDSRSVHRVMPFGNIRGWDRRVCAPGS